MILIAFSTSQLSLIEALDEVSALEKVRRNSRINRETRERGNFGERPVWRCV